MRDDATLVELAVQGDSAAFAELYERYFDRVFDFLARMVRSEAEAADLAQDTFLRAMNSLASLAKGGSFKSWLFTIARNTALNRIERNSRLQPLQGRSDDDDEPGFDLVDDDRFGDPEQAAEAKSLAAYVWEAAKGLEPNQYAVLDLSVRQGLDSAEIADVLGVTKNNAYVMVNRLRKSLEDAIGALVLFKGGRGSCPELDAALMKIELGEMSPEARRVIDRHSTKCPACSDRKRKMASPFAIFGGLAMLQPAMDTKAAILEGLLESYPHSGGGAAANAGDSTQAATGGSGFSGYAAPLPVADDDGGSSKAGLWRFAAGAAAVLIVGLMSFIVVSSKGGIEEETSETLAILASATTVPAIATGTPAATETVTPEATETAVTAPPPVTPAPGPAPIQPGPTQPGIVAPDGPTPGPQPQIGPSPEPPITTPPCVPSIGASMALLDFGTALSSLTFTLGGNGCGVPADYAAAVDEDWITVTPASGSVPPGGSVPLTVRVNRAQQPEGGSATVTISGSWGSVRLPVRVSEAAGRAPTITPTRPSLVVRPTSTPTCTVVGGQTFCN